MDSTKLETWAVEMAAKNTRPFDWISPVILYRNGKPALLGAYVQMEDGKELVFTAAHGFSIDYPACVWSYRKLIPENQSPRLIVRAKPMRDKDDDVAICTPASVLQLAHDPLPNFYNGFRRGLTPTYESGRPVTGTARSVLTGEDIAMLGEAYIDGQLHTALDIEAEQGHSGSVFVDESENRMYVLRAYSPTLATFMKESMPHAVKRGVSFMLRLAYA